MWAASPRKPRPWNGQLAAGFLSGACFVALLFLLTSEGCRGPGALVAAPLSRTASDSLWVPAAVAAAARLS